MHMQVRSLIAEGWAEAIADRLNIHRPPVQLPVIERLDVSQRNVGKLSAMEARPGRGWRARQRLLTSKDRCGSWSYSTWRRFHGDLIADIITIGPDVYRVVISNTTSGLTRGLPSANKRLEGQRPQPMTSCVGRSRIAVRWRSAALVALDLCELCRAATCTWGGAVAPADSAIPSDLF